MEMTVSMILQEIDIRIEKLNEIRKEASVSNNRDYELFSITSIRLEELESLKYWIMAHGG